MLNDEQLNTIPAPPNDNKRVIVAMSGGVDSAVTAALLKQRGWEPIGVFMRSGPQHKNPEQFSKGCCSVEDAMDARKVSNSLDIPFYVANFEQDFKPIIDYFVAEYNRGKTPNPCIQCNRLIKFGVLLDYARELGCSKIATGHYARLSYDNNRYQMKRGIDASKDQSYVLFPLSQEQLKDTLFPLGHFEKPIIREIAKNMDLRIHDKADSVEICFVPDNNYRLLLKEHIPADIRPGNFLDTDGTVIGQHDGFQNYTIGQRRGLGQAFGKPMYVKKIDATNNTVELSEDDGLFKDQLVASDLNWISKSAEQIQDGQAVLAQIRYNHKPVPATLHWQDNNILVKLSSPERAIAPGQAVVFYDKDLVLGGGWIT